MDPAAAPPPAMPGNAQAYYCGRHNHLLASGFWALDALTMELDVYLSWLCISVCCANIRRLRIPSMTPEASTETAANNGGLGPGGVVLPSSHNGYRRSACGCVRVVVSGRRRLSSIMEDGQDPTTRTDVRTRDRHELKKSLKSHERRGVSSQDEVRWTRRGPSSRETRVRSPLTRSSLAEMTGMHGMPEDMSELFAPVVCGLPGLHTSQLPLRARKAGRGPRLPVEKSRSLGKAVKN